MADFFDEFGKKVADVASDLSKKAGDTMEVQKLKSEIRFLKRTGAGKYSTPFVLGKAISLNVTPNYAEGSLNADDGQAEYDKEFNYADVTLGTSTLPIEAHEKMFGHTVSTEGKEVTMNANDESSYVGTGWVTVEKIDGVRFFKANVLVKVKYSEPSEEYSTKGDSIEYKTPSISGRALKEDDGTWKKVKQFDTEKEALDYIYKFFGVTNPQETV